MNSKQIILKKRTDEQIIQNHPCSKIQNSPYVCNGCPLMNRCLQNYVIYLAEKANTKYLEIKG